MGVLVVIRIRGVLTVVQLSGVLEARLMKECLDQTEPQEADDSGDADLERRVGADELECLRQEVGNGRGDHDAGRERHEGVQSMAEPQRCDPAGQRGEEREDRDEWHVGEW